MKFFTPLLTLLWPAGHICLAYKESFQVHWDNSIPLHSSIVHSIICTWLFHGKMHFDWFSRIEILQGRWQHGEKVGYCYPSGLENTLFKWEIYVLLFTKGLILSCTQIFYTSLFLYTTSLCLVKVIWLWVCLCLDLYYNTHMLAEELILQGGPAVQSYVWFITGTNLNIAIYFNPLNPELNPICYLLALLGNHHFLHVSRIRVKLLTFRLLMSYIYAAPILDVSRSHTTTQHSR